jgi:hypothetical protein
MAIVTRRLSQNIVLCVVRVVRRQDGGYILTIALLALSREWDSDPLWWASPRCNSQFLERSTQSVAVHAERTRCLAPIALVAREHNANEYLPKFADGLAVSDAAVKHLGDERLQSCLHKHAQVQKIRTWLGCVRPLSPGCPCLGSALGQQSVTLLEKLRATGGADPHNSIPPHELDLYATCRTTDTHNGLPLFLSAFSDVPHDRVRIT